MKKTTFSLHGKQDGSGGSAPGDGYRSRSVWSRGGHALYRGMRWGITFGIPVYGIVFALLFIGLEGVGLQVDTKWVSFGAGVAEGQQRDVSPPTQTVAPAVESRESASVNDVARLTMEASRERIESLKDSYDKLFALIAALGALLAFLGFKGFESFAQAKTRAERTVNVAEEAVRRANDAEASAAAAIADLKAFKETQYPKSATAEIYFAHGVIMREIAEVYEVIAAHLSVNSTKVDFPERGNRLRDSQVYLERALNGWDKTAPSRSRALGTLGNVRKRLGDFHGALSAVRAAAKSAPEDGSAYYNVACYATLVAAEKARQCNPEHEAQVVAEYVEIAIAGLRRAIVLSSSFAGKATKERDLQWLRDHDDYRDDFLRVIEERQVDPK